MSAGEEELFLYVRPACGFCRRVLLAIDRLGIHLEIRDIWQSETDRNDLMAAQGRTTVPVLRIRVGETDRWMPESEDIIRYLEHRFSF